MYTKCKSKNNTMKINNLKRPELRKFHPKSKLLSLYGFCLCSFVNNNINGMFMYDFAVFKNVIFARNVSY